MFTPVLIPSGAPRPGLVHVVRRIQPTSGGASASPLGIQKKSKAAKPSGVMWCTTKAGERGLPKEVCEFMRSNTDAGEEPDSMEEDTQQPAGAGTTSGAAPAQQPAPRGKRVDAREGGLPNLPPAFTRARESIGASIKNPADPKHPKPAPLRDVVWYGPKRVPEYDVKELPDGRTLARPNKILTPGEHLIAECILGR